MFSFFHRPRMLRNYQKALLVGASVLDSVQCFRYLHQTFNLSRSGFVRIFALHSLGMPIPGVPKSIQSARALLDSVYGPLSSPLFPKPMPEDEAGICADGHQRRYLWTDAFGVLAYLSLGDALDGQGHAAEAMQARQAAHKLIDVVHECLGKPRSGRDEDEMMVDLSSPTGYLGLRIGKAHTRKVTDYGMRYDGQYWHYIDKWLLALSRAGRIDEGIRFAKSVFSPFFDAGPEGDGVAGGIRWKLSVDATPPPQLARANANDDTLAALIVFSILENHRTSENMPNLAGEISLLRSALSEYKPQVTDDPLGWGLEALYDQFIDGHPRFDTLHSLHLRALHPSHLSLPFRLYGAMIGARVVGSDVAPAAMVDDLVQISLEHEANAQRLGHEEHSSINRVMLAMCLLCPGKLGRQPNDPLISLPT